ncbi:MAG: hypothetical protein WCF36_11380 [Candidatus Nanopelagicales bacterium]
MVYGVPLTGVERVLSVIPNVSFSRGFLGLKTRSCSLVLTDRRVLVARFTMAQGKALGREARDHAKADGKGRMGQLAAQSHVWDTVASTYRSMPLEQILAENPDNIAVDRASITNVKVAHKKGSDTTVASDTLVIETSGKKYKFTFMGSMRQAREALATAGLN